MANECVNTVSYGVRYLASQHSLDVDKYRNDQSKTRSHSQQLIILFKHPTQTKPVGKQTGNMTISEDVSTTSSEIDRRLATARSSAEKQANLLIVGDHDTLGWWEMFKRLHLQCCDSGLTEEELRMYGVFVRSNMLRTIKRLCELAKDQKHAEEWWESPLGSPPLSKSPREFYNRIVTGISTVSGDSIARLKEAGARSDPSQAPDWVGISVQAGPMANVEANLFLELLPCIQALWKVRFS